MREKHLQPQPFIRVREVTSVCPNAGYWNDLAPALKRQYFMAFWSEARFRRHLEMLKAFGFNSIEISLVPQIANNARVSQEQWRTLVHLQCRLAHELGFAVSQFVWGATVANGPTGFQNLDWHKPEDRARLETEYRSAAGFAPYVDRVITHWVDPGKPQPGGIDTVVEMHNVILGFFRAQNPKIRGALSTWFMSGAETGHRYPGYDGPGQLAAHPQLDRDTDIVLGLLNYDADGVNLDPSGELKVSDLDAIAVAGRPAGPWGWYTTDLEIVPALHVHTDLLQNYFRSLPSQTCTALAWHSIDDTCQGLNMQNLYVAGRLMQNPALAARKLLIEFAAGFVGHANATALTKALRAVEQARTRSRRYSVEIQGAVAPQATSPKQRLPLPAPWLDNTASAVDAAIAGLRTVKLEPNFKTAWPVTMEPVEYLIELQAHLEAIRQMLAFLKGVREVERLHCSGAPAEQLEAAIHALPPVVHDPAHTAGLESLIYQQKLAAIKQALGVK